MLYIFYKPDGNMGDSLEWLRIVAKQHDEWVKIVNSFGEYNYAEDIVQEGYLALIKYAKPENIIKDNKMTRGYMYFTLRSIYYQYYNKKKKVKKISIDNEDINIQLPYVDDIDEQEAFHKICTMVDDIADGWNWYDRKLWKLYSQTDMSIRKLAKETKISWVSIFNTLKNLKEELRFKLGEDFEDYINNDYDKL